MEDALQDIGLTAKEARVYALLLKNGAQSAAQLADDSGEKRTNVYALVEGLRARGLVEPAAGTGVKRFQVTDPGALQALLSAERERLSQTAAAFQAVLPHIRAQYALTTNKPGVVHMAGHDGLLRLLDDMVNSKTEVLLVASNDADVEGLGGFKERLLKRQANGVHTRALAHDHDRERRRTMYAERGMDLRFLGELPFSGEVVVYENNVAFTVYEPSLIVTVLTNDHIADTMRSLFEHLWSQAE